MTQTSNSATVVTGSSGFIGSHLMKVLSEKTVGDLVGIDLKQSKKAKGYIPFEIDITDKDQLPLLKEPFGNCSLVHLAAVASVQVDTLETAEEMVLTNELGFINTLRSLEPNLVVLASSGAVYGQGEGYNLDGAPRGLYGCTKNSDEKILSLWSAKHEKNGIALRFGNVIGPGCRGLIPYLLAHAKKFPEGQTPALCRGHGQISRDYVPVEYVVSVITEALQLHPSLEPGFRAYDVGSGVSLTNREVGEIVTDELDKVGFKLRIDWDAPLVVGETSSTVLGMARTWSTFSQVPRPDRGNIEKAIRDAVRSGF